MSEGSINNASGTTTTTIANYLLTRLSQLGVKTVQGVPGDYNLEFLDCIEDHESLNWVGNANELNAAYSADGYARINGTPGVVVTTFGVGELSALNGIAGCFSEQIPVIHIVGVPSTTAQGAQSLLHHTLGDGRFDAFEIMSRKITAAAALITETDNAAKEIDRVLSIAMVKARPVYISLPADLVHEKISAEKLAKPIDVTIPKNDSKAEGYVLKTIMDHISKAERPTILVDSCAIRHRVLDETLELVNKSGFSVFSTPMGRTAIDEDHPQFGGIYLGSATHPGVRQAVEQADVLIIIGALKSDFNTGNFTYRTPKESTIELHSSYTVIGYSHYPEISMKGLLPKLSAQLAGDRERRLKVTEESLPKYEALYASPLKEKKPEIITHEWFWPRIGRFFKAYDQIIVETGTASFGLMNAKLPAKSICAVQVLWGSIGWSVGATLGCALAARERKLGRTILFVGDGSLQLSVQEIGTMVRQGLTPILFVLNNDGYEIERQIHGPQRQYNNIARWNHSLLLDFMSEPTTGPGTREKIPSELLDSGPSHKADPSPSKTKYHAARTAEELEKLLNDKEFNECKSIQLVEVFMRRGDAPLALVRTAEAGAEEK